MSPPEVHIRPVPPPPGASPEPVTGALRRAIPGLLILASLVGGSASAASTLPITDPETARRVDEFGQGARSRLLPYFEAAGVVYPAASVVLVGLKQERKLELYAGASRDEVRFIRSYAVRGVSGRPGPKLMEGDRQVPEGIYQLDALNPNSRFHLSMRVGYPNEFDRRMAALDGRRHLGGDIFIHGGVESAGCLAMGDRAIEELFVLTAQTGLERVEVILSPEDLRGAEPRYERDRGLPGWTDELYGAIRRALSRLPPPRWPRWSAPGGSVP